MSLDFSLEDARAMAGGATLTPSLRGLVVAAKLLQAPRGSLRICAASPGVGAFAARKSFRHLLRLDSDRAAALARVGPPIAHRSDRPAPGIARQEVFP